MTRDEQEREDHEVEVDRALRWLDTFAVGDSQILHDEIIGLRERAEEDRKMRSNACTALAIARTRIAELSGDREMVTRKCRELESELNDAREEHKSYVAAGEATGGDSAALANAERKERASQSVLGKALGELAEARERVEQLGKLAYPDGPDGNAGWSTQEFIQARQERDFLRAELTEARNRVEELEGGITQEEIVRRLAEQERDSALSRIKELEAERDLSLVAATQAVGQMANACAERDSLRAELAEARKRIKELERGLKIMTKNFVEGT